MFSDAETPSGKLYAGIQLTRPLLRNITARVEQDLEGTGISVGQRAILEALLHLEPATAPQLTSALQVTRQFVARELKELMQLGLVLVSENPKHRRSPMYRMSEACRARIVEIRRRETAEVAAFAEQFSEADIDAYFRIQSALNDAFSKP